MKCRAMRLGSVDENRDIEDIRRLGIEIGIRSAAQAIDLVSSFYPQSRLQPKVQFGLEEIFTESNDGHTSIATPGNFNKENSK